MSSDAFYNELLPEINDVIDEFGTTFVVNTPGAYNKNDMSVAPDTTREVAGIIADQNFQVPLGGAGVEVSWASKKQVLFKAEANLQENESVIVDGVEHPVTKVDTIKPANVVLLYMLDITK